MPPISPQQTLKDVFGFDDFCGGQREGGKVGLIGHCHAARMQRHLVYLRRPLAVNFRYPPCLLGLLGGVSWSCAAQGWGAQVLLGRSDLFGKWRRLALSHAIQGVMVEPLFK